MALQQCWDRSGLDSQPPLKTMQENDEDLSLFREMRRLEFASDEGGKLMSPSSTTKKIPVSTTSCDASNMVEDMFSSDWDKHDYDWLMTPPSALPIKNLTENDVSAGCGFPPKNTMVVRSLTSSNSVAKPAPPCGPNPSGTMTGASHKPPSPINTLNRVSTLVTGRLPSIPSTPSSANSSRQSSPTKRPSTPPSNNRAPSITSVPSSITISRPSTPGNRGSSGTSASSSIRRSATLSRPATPTKRPSTPGSNRGTSTTSIAASSSTRRSATLSRPATPTKRPSTPNSSRGSSATPVSSSSSSSTRRQGTLTRPSTPTGLNPSAPRPSTPTGKRPSTPTGKVNPARNAMPKNVTSATKKVNSEEPHSFLPSRSAPSSRQSSPSKSRAVPPPLTQGLAIDPPPNLRTSMPLNLRGSSGTARPGMPIASRGGVPIDVVGSTTRPRRAASPSMTRGQQPMSPGKHNNGHSIPQSATKSPNGGMEVSIPVIGNKVSENVMQTRKVVGMAQEDPQKTKINGQVEKPKSPMVASKRSAGFGRNLSKTSLDMALRHMDIRRSKPGGFGPLMAAVPASSIYSVRPGYGQGNGIRARVASPVATSSNASSEHSVIVPEGDGIEFSDDNGGFEKHFQASPSALSESLLSSSEGGDGGIMIKRWSESPDNRDDGADTLQLFRQDIEGFSGPESPLFQENGWFSNHDHNEESLF